MWRREQAREMVKSARQIEIAYQFTHKQRRYWKNLRWYDFQSKYLSGYLRILGCEGFLPRWRGAIRVAYAITGATQKEWEYFDRDSMRIQEITKAERIGEAVPRVWGNLKRVSAHCDRTSEKIHTAINIDGENPTIWSTHRFRDRLSRFKFNSYRQEIRDAG